MLSNETINKLRKEYGNHWWIHIPDIDIKQTQKINSGLYREKSTKKDLRIEKQKLEEQESNNIESKLTDSRNREIILLEMKFGLFTKEKALTLYKKNDISYNEYMKIIDKIKSNLT